MNTKTVGHTPGPWQAKKFCSPQDTFYIVDSRDHLLVGAGKKIEEANAQLIAAAPELLEALEQCRAFSTGLSNGNEQARLRDIATISEAAIKRARGDV